MLAAVKDPKVAVIYDGDEASDSAGLGGSTGTLLLTLSQSGWHVAGSPGIPLRVLEPATTHTVAEVD